ncbi:MAG TPA: hypothetical protein VK629_14685 [Steroidobacteraceae bacterium]|nr:hypothetical protein [Steroidobacteraceae bacterium]
MTQVIVVYKTNSIKTTDLDLWCVRHFLVLGAERLMQEGKNYEYVLIREFIMGWQWSAPGIVGDTNLTSVVGGKIEAERALKDVFTAAKEILKTMGSEIGLSYLRENEINTAVGAFDKAPDTKAFIEIIDELRNLVVYAAPDGPPIDL